MKAVEIYKMAMSLTSQKVYETSQAEVFLFVPAYINILLAETLGVENSIRKSKGLPLLEKAQKIDEKDWEDTEIIYQDELCDIALPYGLASYIYQDDDNEYRAAEYRSRYVAAVNAAEKVTVQPIKDVYWEG